MNCCGNNVCVFLCVLWSQNPEESMGEEEEDEDEEEQLFSSFSQQMMPLALRAATPGELAAVR